MALRKILLVEDEESVARNFKTLFTLRYSWEVEVTIASTSTQAMEIINSWWNFNVLISDTNLEWEEWNLKWIDVAKAFREKNQGAYIIWTSAIEENAVYWEWVSNTFMKKMKLLEDIQEERLNHILLWE